MHKLRALTTLQWLLKGKNPITKRPLPTDSIYRNPEITTALFIAMQALEAQVAQEQQMLSTSSITDPYIIDIAVLNHQKHSNQQEHITAAIEALVVQEIDPSPGEMAPSKKQKADAPLNAGKPWNLAEDEELIRAFDAGVSINALAAKHQRTAGSINARLMRHGRIVLPLESHVTDRQSSTEEDTEAFELPW
jgi:hypothetical protein